MPDVLLESRLPFPCRRGKVRDVYDLDEALLIVATDRISAFDCVLPTGIPDKGRVLTRLSNWWFARTGGIIANHLIATDVTDFPRAARSFADQLIGRSVLVKKTRVIPIECVARGYLAGSGWKEYQQSGTVCGQKLPRGLKQCAKLPAPIFTPANKAETGHDENISFEETARRIGEPLAAKLRNTTIALYDQAAKTAAERGILLADTKFEFGQLPGGEVILIDEILTPDSSRFWNAADYAPGRDQQSFDKQFVRDYLERSSWNKSPPAPPLPDDVVAGTRDRYVKAFECLTQSKW
ncbi:MAG TPA: phosphoribosylaminoimidazolesuccinocarboxamide synthase [Tepidisphaeraceae bacterium]|jgi:phosphoribosylaminoimidazole-succinocarboxamide synthase